MRKSAIILLLLMLGGLVIQANAEVMGRYIVTLRGPAESAVLNAGGSVDHVYTVIPAMAIQVPEPALKGLARHPAITSIEPDVVVQALKKPSWVDDKKKKEQPPQVLEWGVDRIDADLAWDASATGAGINVAIVDTGIDPAHPDLQANIQGGINYVATGRKYNPNKWSDDNGHGTYVAGIVAAIENEIGVVGVAPDAALFAVKVLNKQGSGYISDIIAGIDWSVVNGMDVVNMSLGAQVHVQALEDACDAAEAAGVLLVAAAGNDGDLSPDDDVDYPGRYGSVIAVAATDAQDERASWSSDGLEVELSAPGVDVRSTWKSGGYATENGTSAASPHVAGTAALVLSTVIPSEYDDDSDGIWDPTELRTCLINAADDLGALDFDRYYGYGLVDAEESVTGIETNP